MFSKSILLAFCAVAIELSPDDFNHIQELSRTLTIPFRLKSPPIAISSKSINSKYSMKSLNQSAQQGAGYTFIQAGETASTLTGDIYLGTPPVKMTVLFDTGSTTFWIMADSCTTAACRKIPKRYNNKASSTFTPVNNILTKSIQYGDGSTLMCSVRGTDIVQLGSLSVQNQSICETSDVKMNSKIGGIVGIGSPTYRRQIVSNFWGNMMANKLLTRNIMAQWFNNDVLQDDLSEAAGEIQFGALNPKKYTGEINYIPLNENSNYWTLQMNAIKFGNQEIPVTYDTSVAIDSGTTMVLFPSDIAKSLNQKMGARLEDGLYTISCDRVTTIPPIEFYFTGSSKPLILQGSQLVYTAKQPGYAPLCVSIIQPNGDLPIAIIGAWFLRSFYTVFDYDNRAVGFADSVGRSNPFVVRYVNTAEITSRSSIVGAILMIILNSILQL